MSDEEFEMLLADVIMEYGANCIEFPEGKYDEPHEFSPRFEKKMQKLIRRERRFYFPLVKTPVRRLVTIVITVIVALSVLTMSVGAFRNAFFHFLTEVFSTHTTVMSAETASTPTDFRDVYEPVEIPDGYELVQKSDPSMETAYLFLCYTKDDRYIIFRQWLKSEYDIDINTEQNEAEPIEINGFEGFILIMGEDMIVTWDNGDYIFEATSNIGKNALILLVKSVQKVEF